MGVEIKNKTSWFIDLFKIKEGPVTEVKRDTVFRFRYVKWVRLLIIS